MKIYLGWAIIYQIMYHKSHVSHESMCSGRFADFKVMKIIHTDTKTFEECQQVIAEAIKKLNYSISRMVSERSYRW